MAASPGKVRAPPKSYTDKKCLIPQNRGLKRVRWAAANAASIQHELKRDLQVYAAFGVGDDAFR